MISKEGRIATVIIKHRGAAYLVVRFPGSKRGYKLDRMEAVDKGIDLAVLSIKLKRNPSFCQSLALKSETGFWLSGTPRDLRVRFPMGL